MGNYEAVPLEDFPVSQGPIIHDGYVPDSEPMEYDPTMMGASPTGSSVMPGHMPLNFRQVEIAFDGQNRTKDQDEMVLDEPAPSDDEAGSSFPGTEEQ